ncbi:IPT/TIG domain-containing protein [candidate division KSB1 bacterium]|nr:IPT/TIG domain-containing protein [bacterium]NUM69107.1 IPT/TIG domain-containing protein [candidate division KSB1 bacterium]
MNARFTLYTLVTACVFCGLACEAPENATFGPGRPDPNPTGLPAATLTAVEPTEGFLRDVITLRGSGFNTTPEFNLVQFGNRTGVVLAASATELSVRTPNFSDATVMVRVAVKGSEHWSNEMNFTFKPTLTVVDEEISWPKGVAVDAGGNVYVGSGNDGIIFKITPGGDKSEFAHTTVDGSLHFGPGGYLYVCDQGEHKITRVSPDGGTVEDYFLGDSLAVVDFDWDASGNLYLVANDAGVFRAGASGGVTLVAELGSPKSCRVFQSHLFVTDIWETGSVWRYDITASGLENGEIIHTNEDSPPTGLEVDNEGTVYVSEAWDVHILAIKTDGSTEILYDGELATPMRYLTLHNKTMYAVHPGWGDVGIVYAAYIGVEQAPRYGP